MTLFCRDKTPVHHFSTDSFHPFSTVNIPRPELDHGDLSIDGHGDCSINVRMDSMDVQAIMGGVSIWLCSETSFDSLLSTPTAYSREESSRIFSSLSVSGMEFSGKPHLLRRDAMALLHPHGDGVYCASDKYLSLL